MKKIQDQESKISKLAEDDQKRQEHIKKRKEQWEDKLKKKKDEVCYLLFSILNGMIQEEMLKIQREMRRKQHEEMLIQKQIELEQDLLNKSSIEGGGGKKSVKVLKELDHQSKIEDSRKQKQDY